jgi:hypothetical protein
LGVVVYARHPVAQVREARPRGEPHVSGPYDTNIKWISHLSFLTLSGCDKLDDEQ